MVSSSDKTSQPSARLLLARLTLAGAVIGMAVGLWEARLVYFLPSAKELLRADATYVIWFLAPAVDLLVFGGLGAALGCLAALAKVRHPKIVALLTAVLASAAAAYAAWALHLLHLHTGITKDIQDLLYPLRWFGLALALFVLAGMLLWRWISLLFDPMRPRHSLGTMARWLAAAGAVLVLGLIFYAGRPWTLARTVSAGTSRSNPRPNIVLITIDTARADHFSAYGYGRPTTPNMDRMASRGVLFENALAPCSWTLPSLASILVGTLPHQHGGDTFRPVVPSMMTLGEALRARGYESAGFNANSFYGLTGWGLDQGFEPYGDDASSLDYNLARTLVGRLTVQPIYQTFRHYQPFFRRSAEEVNREVAAWFRRRSNRPYFLYINYYDVHAPYLAPQPYEQRFGTFSEKDARLNMWLLMNRPDSVAAEQRASLIAGYDNSLAYVDAQIASLMKFLSASPSWANTIVIITADHGEAFGEHGFYGHGHDLHREEIHVPLIVYGPGIPAGRRVAAPVPIRSVFATVLDLALKKDSPLSQYSLARYWDSQPDLHPQPAEVLSELNSGWLSLATAKWHYLRGPRGEEELYDWKTDPEEERNLIQLPEYEPTAGTLRARLKDSLQRSVAPWLGPEYLYALNQPGNRVLKEPHPLRHPSLELLAGPRRIGMVQAYLNPAPEPVPRRLPPSRKELLKSLPYQ